jgi:hypothetical protein
MLAARSAVHGQDAVPPHGIATDNPQMRPTFEAFLIEDWHASALAVACPNSS